MLGQYTILAARGPGANLFWGGDIPGWITVQADAYVFSSVVDAQHTPIVGLPAGYHTSLIPAYVEIVRPVDELSPYYDPCAPDC